MKTKIFGLLLALSVVLIFTNCQNPVTGSTKSSNADLSALTVSSGTLSPEFSAGTLAYSVSVANAVTSIIITGTKSDSTASVSANSGVTQALIVGANIITLSVTAQDGTTVKNYVITVTRDIDSINALGLVTPNADSFQTKITTAIQSECTDRSIMLTIKSATDQSSQKESIRELLLLDLDGIIVYGVSTTGWSDVLSEAKAANMPVFFFGDYVDTSLDYAARFISDDIQMGKMLADWLKIKKTGSMKILELTGSTSVYATNRHNGFINNIPSDWSIIASESGGWNPTDSENQMTTWLADSATDTFDIVYAHNDAMAFGAIEALATAGKSFGSATGEILVVSIDAVEDALASILNNELACTIDQGLMQQDVLFDAIQDYHDGKSIDKTLYAQCFYFDITNIQ